MFYNKFNLKTNDDFANYMWDNVVKMQKNNQPIKGAPSRGIIPQTDIATNWLSNIINTDLVNDSTSIKSSMFVFLGLLILILM